MLSSVRKIIDDIKNMKIRGSTSISIAGVEALRRAAVNSKAKTKKAFIAELEKVANQLSSIRVTEPAERNAMKYVLIRLKLHENFRTIKQYADTLCRNYERELKDTVRVIAEIGADIIVDGDTILTHCHSENVVEILKEAKKIGKKFDVIVTETRPKYQGIITARELLKSKIPVTFCVDSAMGFFMKNATKVIVGCDAILADGSIINKIGTFPLAIVAKEFGVPFYVAGATYKFSTQSVAGKGEEIEMREPNEIIDPKKISGAKILNPAFDVTPAKFISGLVTEKGLTKPEWIHELADGMFA